MQPDPADASGTPDFGRERRAETILFLLWLAAVLLAPVWLGANTPIQWAAHAIVFGLLLAGFAMLRRQLPVPVRRLRVPLSALAVVAVWAAIQGAGITPAAWHHPAWALASSALGEDVGGAVSVYPEAAPVAILWMATAAAVFFLAVQYGRDPGRARLVLLATVGGGAAVAAYGLAVYLTGNKWVLWQPKHAYLNALTATFINRNTFAGYAGTVLTVAFGFLAGELGGLRPLHASGAQRAVALLFLAGTVIVVSAALVLSGSRAGTGVAVLGIGSVSILASTRLRFRRVAVLGVFAAGVLAILFFTAAFGTLLSERIGRFDQDLGGRLALDRSVIEAIAARPLLGHGFGAFEQAYPPYRTAALQQNDRFEYAHDSWLEALMTLGIPVGLVLWLIFLWIFWRCFAGTWRRARDPTYPAIGAAVGLLAAAQSLVDFPVQIEGYAIPLLAILGVAVAQSWSSREIN